MIVSCSQVNRVFPMLYLARYNEPEQLHMQVLLNCHLVEFEWTVQKSNQMTM